MAFFPSNTLLGFRIIVRAYPRVEIPWHRKKRIAKKWRKQRGPRYRYLKVNRREIIMDHQRGLLYCYPAMEHEIYTVFRQTSSQTSYGF